MGFPIKYIFKNIIKKGIFTTIDQILGRLLYKIINSKSDKKRLLEISQTVRKFLPTLVIDYL